MEYIKKLNMLAVKNLYFWEEYTEFLAQCRSNRNGITVAIFRVRR